MIEDWAAIYAFSSLAALVLCLLGYIVSVTIAFGKIETVESMLASPGNQINMTRTLWGKGPIGRWIRAVNVYYYFFFQRIPVIGSKVAARVGEELEPIPRHLRLWVVIPVGFTSFFGLVFLALGAVLIMTD